jgi:hypothetical protein
VASIRFEDFDALREISFPTRSAWWTGNYGGDHGETQRWFEKLPNYLLEKAKRPKVVSALERALAEYRQQEGAEPGTVKPELFKR